MTVRGTILVLALLVLAPVLAHAQENESTGVGNEITSTVEYFENQEEMEEKADDILQVIMRIVRDILRYIQKTLTEMPLME